MTTLIHNPTNLPSSVYDRRREKMDNMPVPKEISCWQKFTEWLINLFKTIGAFFTCCYCGKS